MGRAAKKGWREGICRAVVVVMVAVRRERGRRRIVRFVLLGRVLRVCGSKCAFGVLWI
jgi:hypothetical protein